MMMFFIFQNDQNHDFAKENDELFDTSKIKMTSFKGCPKIIKGNFECDDTTLTSLIGAPEQFEKNYCR